MSVRTVGRRTARPTVLDVAAEVLVADPAASLSDVAEAAGIGRTTLHKHYATRDELMRAVAHRAIDLWTQAVDRVADASEGGLRELTEAMIPIGPQLGFLWRNPIFDHQPDIIERWTAVERRGLAVLQRERTHGTVMSDVADWWLLQTLYSLVYVASESVRSGVLAPRDAPNLVIRTFLHGLGIPTAERKLHETAHPDETEHPDET